MPFSDAGSSRNREWMTNEGKTGSPGVPDSSTSICPCLDRVGASVLNSSHWTITGSKMSSWDDSEDQLWAPGYISGHRFKFVLIVGLSYRTQYNKRQTELPWYRFKYSELKCSISKSHSVCQTVLVIINRTPAPYNYIKESRGQQADIPLNLYRQGVCRVKNSNENTPAAAVPQTS